MLQILVCLLMSWSVFANSVIDAPVNPIDFMQNPAQVDWRKIDTTHFEIIFPRQIEGEAQRVAHLLEKVYPYVTRSMEVSPPKISLVLQANSTVSNGFVTLAPRRTEWYMTPAIDPELGSTEWLHTLAVHEFRHVVQFEKSKQKFNRVWYWVLGEIGQAIGLGFTMPPWFLEGDAVGIETALTRGGRGRLPMFERDLRALLLSGKDFDYDKAHLGSYEDYIPNHYIYGYFYTTYLRNKYGDKVLSMAANESARAGYNPLSFYRSIDRLSGRRFETFYEETISDMIQQWKAKLDKIKPTPYEVKSLSSKEGWTNYRWPQVLDDGKILAYKTGLSYIPHFVLIDGKKEEKLFYPSYFMNEYPLKVRKNKMAFVEYEVDPRWGYRDFGRLKVYDVKEDEFVLDVRKTKYRSAIVDHQGERILASEWTPKQNQYIVVLNQDGKVEERQEFPSEEVITSLDWISSDEIVLVIKNRDGFKSIEKYSLKTKSRQALVAATRTNIGYVTSEKGHIFFESPESGIDNIFMVEDGKTQQLTSSRFGAYAPHLNGDDLYYEDYTAEGMTIVKKSLRWNEEQKSSDSFVPFYEKFAQMEKVDELEGELLKREKYSVQKYSQIKNAPNVHSWLLFAVPLSPLVVAQFYSRDILNKFSLSGGAQVNLNEGTVMGFVGSAWSHLYTVFDLRGAYGKRRQETKENGKDVESRWEEGTFDAGISVPWQKLSGRFAQAFSTRAFSRVIKVTNKRSNNPTNVNDGALLSPGAELSYSALSRTAHRDIYPQWGYALNGRIEEGKDITGTGQRGSIATIDNRLYLPGLMKHHSFFHQFAYEKQRNHYYEYASYIYYPRGLDYDFIPEFTKYSANYTFPVWNADAHWSRYIYLKRLYANLFYDELKGSYGNFFTYKAASYGWEVLFETNFVRIFLPITWGVRGSYRINGNGPDDNYELFLSQALGVF